MEQYKGSANTAYVEICKKASSVLKDLEKMKFLDEIPNQIEAPRMRQPYGLDKLPPKKLNRDFKRVL